MARRAEGYEGRVPTLWKTRMVRAVHVYNKRTAYENTACGLDFQREAGKFLTVPGEKRAPYRPDVIFTDAEDKMLLFTKIHVTQEVDYKKLVALRRAQVEAI